MTTIRRLTDSCVLVTTDNDATLFEPGFHTFTSGLVDLKSIGDVSRVLITHEHADHVSPDFVSWLRQRRSDLGVYSNEAVARILEKNGVEATTSSPKGVTIEDVTHEPVPSGATPPNRAFTIGGVITHPGDSYGPTICAPVLALPLMTPWGSATAAVEFARRLGPRQVIPVHDFYLNGEGRSWLSGMVGGVLASSGIEMVPLDWGESFTV